MSDAEAGRTGAGAAIEALAAAGVRRAFGIPGVHSLPLFEALAGGSPEFVGGRTELAAAFSADGHARRTGEPTALLLSTGPGTMMSLGGLMEAASAHVPVVVLASQIGLDDLGRRRGALHENPDQLGSVRPQVKWARRAAASEQLAPLVAEAVATAMTPPTGPVYLELPVDLLSAPAHRHEPAIAPGAPAQIPARGDFEAARRLLAGAARPVIWAGGGVVRGGAQRSLLKLAEGLDAPVATTYMGKGAIDERHALAAGSACEERALLDLIEGADLVVAVGTELGAETTAQWKLELRGDLIQIDASPERIGTSFPALPLIGDAAPVLDRLAAALPAKDGGEGSRRAEATRTAIRRGLERGDRGALALLDTIREAVPWSTATAWDMTIAGYWAASAFPVAAGRGWLYPLGSGTLGYAAPAALGAAAAGEPALAVTGDGGAMYALSELPVMAEQALPLTWLIVDDGGYGVLRHYQEQVGNRPFGVKLARPDFAALARAAGVPARATDRGGLGDALRAAQSEGGPSVVVLETSIEPPPALA